jgi:hypothetical protein
MSLNDEAKMASELLADCSFFSANCKSIESAIFPCWYACLLPSSNREFDKSLITTSLLLKCHISERAKVTTSTKEMDV